MLEALPKVAPGTISRGRFESLGLLSSDHVAPRGVTVWLPDGYAESATYYSVLYMHDGQNLFFPGVGFGGDHWDVHSKLSELMDEQQVQKTIIVGINNTDKRFREYLPDCFFDRLCNSTREAIAREYSGRPLAKEYLRFITEELKPLIDQRYRVLPDKEHTFIAGSSMGALISMYAVMQHPETFAGAACISTHWPLSTKTDKLKLMESVSDFVNSCLPPPGKHKLYFDFGTEELDAWYEPYQLEVNKILTAKSFIKNKDWCSHKFEGAGHKEEDWRARVKLPLRFLLG